MSDESVSKIETLLGQLSWRFELVIEAADGFNSRLDNLQEQLLSQFAEVGKQIRFLSDQIGDNRARINGLRTEFAAEMVRLNENLGATRIELRKDLASVDELKSTVAALGKVGGPGFSPEVTREIAQRLEQIQQHLREDMERQAAELREEISTQLAEFGKAAASATAGVAGANADTLLAEMRAEAKITQKTMSSLLKKFERFDDRITVQVKDQDQRLRKLERAVRG